MKIRIKKLHEDAVIPKYQTSGASGFDLHAVEDVTIIPGETKLVRTGLAIDTGPGHEMQVRPRSGLSLKTPLRIANSPGTVDSDFTGEVCVIITNSNDWVHDGHLFDPSHAALTKLRSYEIKKGDRIAQGVICPVVQADIEVVEYLGDTQRGAGGFGSTGRGF
jgi:dUTP pyrophosphatase